MADIIRLLPDSVANQIAAGEVIQRPSSVIKELVENSADAGASEINIYIKDAGKTLIQVVDNGKGMSEMDARMAFERHATSKISKADDLFTLQTMGFRGEALPSICAISCVEVKTRTPDSPMGTLLTINGSKVESQTPVMCDVGTSISVKNIFFNIPARRKFLKSDNVELANVMREFERLALVNNKIRMSIDTGFRTVDLRPGSFKQRIGDLWKNNLSMTLLPVNIDTSLVKIEGFMSRPEYARRRNALQFMIVNGRNMRHGSFHKAIISCFEQLIASDTQPCYFLKFTVDPATIDVNISPTKNEIKFENESEIRELLRGAVKASLGKNSAVPSIDFTSAPIEIKPLRGGDLPKSPDNGMPADYNPFYTPPARKEWEDLYESFMGNAGRSLKDDAEPDANTAIPGIRDEETRNGFCLQTELKYIITISREGLMIIDQHRAHVRVLYDDIMSHASSGELVSQRVLFPELLTLDGTMQAALEEVEEELTRLGFILEPNVEGTWNIIAVPSFKHGMKGDLSAGEVILRILESVTEDSTNYGKDDRKDTGENILSRVALLTARASAIERGRKLTQSEMENLVAELFKLPNPQYTPNGNRIYTILDDNRLSGLLH